MKKKSKNFLLIFLGIITTLLIFYTCYKLIPFLSSLKDPSKQETFKNFIKENGIKGFIYILIIQVLQIFIAFIPGEIVEILSGILYGALGGLIICMLGILIGSFLIYYTVKLLANRNLDNYKQKLMTYSFLNNPKKVKIYLFILFLTPGIPKDIFIYLAPFLPIKFSSFLIISLIARIPSILSSTLIGNYIFEGNYLISVIIFVVFACIGLIVILFKDKLMSAFKKHNDKCINNASDSMEN